MTRVLAIDPITKGFGFAVLEGPEALIDWGTKGRRDRREPYGRWCRRQVASLMDLYTPDLVLVEDDTDPRSRRGARSRQLIAGIVSLALTRGVRARRVPKKRIGRTFASAGRCTKYKVALAIAGRFPELARRLPPIRKPWMSEDARMGIFDAVALALSSYPAGFTHEAEKGSQTAGSCQR